MGTASCGLPLLSLSGGSRSQPGRMAPVAPFVAPVAPIIRPLIGPSWTIGPVYPAHELRALRGGAQEDLRRAERLRAVERGSAAQRSDPAQDCAANARGHATTLRGTTTAGARALRPEVTESNGNGVAVLMAGVVSTFKLPSNGWVVEPLALPAHLGGNPVALEVARRQLESLAHVAVPHLQIALMQSMRARRDVYRKLTDKGYVAELIREEALVRCPQASKAAPMADNAKPAADDVPAAANPEEARRKIREHMRLKWMDPYYRLRVQTKMRAVMTGRKLSDAHREAIREQATRQARARAAAKGEPRARTRRTPRRPRTALRRAATSADAANADSISPLSALTLNEADHHPDPLSTLTVSTAQRHTASSASGTALAADTNQAVLAEWLQAARRHLNARPEARGDGRPATRGRKRNAGTRRPAARAAHNSPSREPTSRVVRWQAGRVVETSYSMDAPADP
eukprot:ctg_1008.g418